MINLIMINLNLIIILNYQLIFFILILSIILIIFFNLMKLKDLTSNFVTIIQFLYYFFLILI